MRTVGLLLLSLFLVGCQVTPTKESSNSQVINFTNKTNLDATNILVETMAKKGFQVKKLSPSQFRVDYDGSHFIMEPRLVPGGLSRIVVSRLFGVKEEYRHSPELFVMIVSLNRNLNFAKFSMLPENKAG